MEASILCYASEVSLCPRLIPPVFNASQYSLLASISLPRESTSYPASIQASHYFLPASIQFSHYSLPASISPLCNKRFKKPVFSTSQYFPSLQQVTQKRFLSLFFVFISSCKNTEDIADNEPSWEKHSVFKLPLHITSLDNDAFKPIVVSFGPYHHDEEQLKPMETHKARSLRRYCNMTRIPPERLLLSFQRIKQQLMECYDQLDNKWENEDCFLKMMIKDGCFLLDVIKADNRERSANDYNANDPVFGQSGHSIVVCRTIKRDMLLTENQLPLLVLDKLITEDKALVDEWKGKESFEWAKVERGEMLAEKFIHLQVHRFILYFLGNKQSLLVVPGGLRSDKDLCLHPLDVLKEHIIQKEAQPEAADVRPSVGPATKLRSIGIVFTVERSGIMGITFKNWALSLPSIFIDKGTMTTFLNLMALENFQACRGREVTTYICFMAKLAYSANDVSLLRSRGIIKTKESDEAIVALFHELAESPLGNPDGCLDVVSQSLCNHVEKYERRWKGILFFCLFIFNMWRSDFQGTYCKTPWRFIGLVAGVSLLILGIIQTFYTVASYYKDG